MNEKSIGTLARIMELRRDPYSRAKSWKEETGGKLLGYFCCLVPEEIIYAAGALPVRITGENRDISKSAAHLQTYCCSLARTGLDMALTGELSFLDGTVFVHTCDTMQRLSDIWRLNSGFEFHADVVFPVRLAGDAAWEYLLREVESFRGVIEEFLGPLSGEQLQNSIRVYNRNRQLLARLYSLRQANPSLLRCDELLWIVSLSALMDKMEHNRLLEELLSELESSVGAEGEEPQEKVQLFGVGSVMEQWDFLRMLEQVGGTIIDDDFCNGHRYFDALAPEDVEPLEGIAMRLWDREICPCKHVSTSTRVDSLTSRIRDSAAEGVLFFLFKFCDPHAFDYPHIKEALDGAGIPSILLEVEQGSVSVESLRTRAEALVETIRGTRVGR